MTRTKTTKNGPKTKRLFGRTDEETHTRAKVAAAIAGIELEKWVEEAVKEKLARESSRVISISGR